MEYTPKRFHCPACGFEPAKNVSEKEYAHCPRCLTAIHEADSEGYECGGKLQPVSIWVKPDDSWEILGRCSLCGEIASTPVSDEDDPVLLLSIAARATKEDMTVNRENKRRKYEKGYYKKHACLDPFTCKVCGREILPEGAGSDHRNHCPYCLSSVHVDNEPGDRASECHGVMEPISVWVRKNGEWAVIHRCTVCGKMGSNRIAADDNPMKLMALALRPYGSPRLDPKRIKNMVKTMEDKA